MNAKPTRSVSAPTGSRLRRLAPAGMADQDAIAYLEHQHREVEELFRQLEGADAEDRRAAILRTIADGLAIHTAIEEHHLYPSARPRLADDISDGTMDDHRDLKRILSDIVDVSVGDPSFDGKLKELRREVERHVQNEERKLFPKLRRVFSSAELASLTQRMRAEQATLEGTEPRLRIYPDQAPNTALS